MGKKSTRRYGCLYTTCSWGCKKNSQGNVETTKGYKLHLDVSDLGFPLTAIVTGANVHDSQLAIPIIDPNKRRDKNRPPLDMAKKVRYKIRSTVERANSHLKDNLIPKAIYVKGHTKISFVLMTSVLCLAAIKYCL
ncbi:MAG: transposase [Spirochaetaceae bacterium]|nr:transposase [Spirochaetaceae bacterium]